MSAANATADGAGDERVPLTARQVTWRRRRASAARTWKEFVRHRSGLFGLFMLILFTAVAIFAPLLVDSVGLSRTQAPGLPLEEPSSQYLLGTDEFGRPVLTLLIYGARVSLLVGLFATIISMVLGTLIGIASGYWRGWLGAMLFRLTEWFLVIPFLPLALVLATLLGGSLFTVGFVIGITSWPGTALLIRAQTLSITARPYMERARVLGAGDWHQMTRHILPNVMPMVFANTTLTVAGAILAETTLSFLGFGDPTSVSWGQMLAFANANGALVQGFWVWLLVPGLALALLITSLTFINFGVDLLSNPHLREG